ncbi:MAG: hypothetical protein LC748_06360 [Thermomicrobia bacterium]|nr:hypothetical protein [Thermomicrobia bacterium]
MGFIEGGTAVLYAVIFYALYYGIIGTQTYKLLVADEEPMTRVFWFVGIAFVSIMVWAIVGAVVYWGILIWFRIWLREPHAWRQDILSDTGWFPFGFILKHAPIPTGGVRGAFIFLGYPVVLLIAAGLVALWTRGQAGWERMTARRMHPEPGAPGQTKGLAR